MKTINQKAYIHFLWVILFCSCNSNVQTSRKDSLEILKTAIASADFKKNFRNLTIPHDTLYILKSKKTYKEWWPNEFKPFYIKYIQDNENNRQPIISKKSDQRIRVGVPKLEVRGDTAYLTLIIFSWNGENGFTLNKSKGLWKVINVHRRVY